MLMLKLQALKAFLGQVPWQIYAGVFAILLVSGSYCKGRSDENAEWEARLERLEAEAKEKADKARAVADDKAKERADDFEREQETLRKVIDDAESDGSNPLDAIFGSVPETD